MPRKRKKRGQRVLILNGPEWVEFIRGLREVTASQEIQLTLRNERRWTWRADGSFPMSNFCVTFDHQLPYNRMVTVDRDGVRKTYCIEGWTALNNLRSGNGGH